MMIFYVQCYWRCFSVVVSDTISLPQLKHSFVSDENGLEFSKKIYALLYSNEAVKGR